VPAKTRSGSDRGKQNRKKIGERTEVLPRHSGRKREGTQIKGKKNRFIDG